MMTLETLIDEAAKKCGGQSALARHLGKSRSQVSEWKAGTEPVSPETIGLLCELLDIDPAESSRMALLAVVEHPKNADKRERLKRAFFASLGLGVALALQTATPTEATAAETDRTEYTLCFVRRMLPRALGWLSRARRDWSKARTAGARGHGSRARGSQWLRGLNARLTWGVAPYPAA